MSNPNDDAAPIDLAALRGEIDRLDREMHERLMQRSAIIERLIAVKKTSQSGSAFRPGREAAMMKALAERHSGLLPLDTVESIWRVIIGTFTYVQAPYTIHADISAGDGPMRDSARFHFGFTVPYQPHPDARAVIAAVAGGRGDLGIFRLDQGASAGDWWNDLIGPDRPKVIARLPFIERDDHPAGTPIFVISKPLADAAVRDVVLYAARFERWRSEAAGAIAGAGGEIVCTTGVAGQLSMLFSVPGDLDIQSLTDLLTQAGAAPAEIAEIGSHAARYRSDGS
ncbi:chorismate mutase [Saliniramus sp.]|uniref:chorismate mutase n=1 Tax=Saliniramus sp. TaxID=2986772 RepID=UPI002CEB797C|nr:chorismate mutase [Saliniramus sp.]HMB10307.1 chorismate mutase [Saliniramus sp.]